VNVAHPDPHSLTPLKPDEDVAPATAVATTDHCAHAPPADNFAAVTPSPHPPVPAQSPPKFNNEVIEFSTIKAAPVNDGKAFRLNKKGEA
jgi:hypothetical protein